MNSNTTQTTINTTSLSTTLFDAYLQLDINKIASLLLSNVNLEDFLQLKSQHIGIIPNDNIIHFPIIRAAVLTDSPTIIDHVIETLHFDDINIFLSDNTTALYYAIINSKLNSAQHLIKKYNANVYIFTSPSMSRQTLLDIAAVHNNINIVQYFIKEHQFSQEEIIKSLFTFTKHGNLLAVQTYIEEFGIDIHVKDKNYNSLLHFASYSNNIDLVQYLITNGISPRSRNRTSDCPLKNALRFAPLNIVMYLIELYDQNDESIAHIIHDQISLDFPSLFNPHLIPEFIDVLVNRFQFVITLQRMTQFANRGQIQLLQHCFEKYEFIDNSTLLPALMLSGQCTSDVIEYCYGQFGTHYKEKKMTPPPITVAIHSCRLDWVQALVKCGQVVVYSDVLALATSKNCIKNIKSALSMIEYFIQYGLSFSMLFFVQLFVTAIECNNLPIIQFIMENNNLSCIIEARESIFTRPISKTIDDINNSLKHQDIKLFQYLYEKLWFKIYPQLTQLPLILHRIKSSTKFNVNEFKYLIQIGINHQQCDTSGHNILHTIINKSTMLNRYELSICIPICDYLLIELGLDCENGVEQTNNTILQTLCQGRKSIQLFQFNWLLRLFIHRYQMNIYAQNNKKETILHLLMNKSNNSTDDDSEIIEIILKHINYNECKMVEQCNGNNDGKQTNGNGVKKYRCNGDIDFDEDDDFMPYGQ